MKLPKTIKWIAAVVIVILVIFMVGFVSNMLKMMRKDFKIKFYEFKSIYLDITVVVENEDNEQKCIAEMSTVETKAKIDKLKEILQYMNDNAKTEYEKGARDSLPQYVKYLEELISYGPPLMEDRLTMQEKRDILNHYVIIKGYRRDFIEKKDYLI